MFAFGNLGNTAAIGWQARERISIAHFFGLLPIAVTTGQRPPGETLASADQINAHICSNWMQPHAHMIAPPHSFPRRNSRSQRKRDEGVWSYEACGLIVPLSRQH